MSNINKLALIPLLMALISSPGCKNCSGFDASALKADAAINYGQMVKNHEIPVEDKLYGQLIPGNNTNGSLIYLFDQIIADINKAKDLDLASSALSSCLADIEQQLKSALNLDVKSPNDAKALTASLEAYVRSNGSLAAILAKCDSHIPDNKKNSYKEISDAVRHDIEKLYINAAASTLALFQGRVAKEVNRINTAISSMYQYINGTFLYDDAFKQNNADKTLLELRAKLLTLSLYRDALLLPTNQASAFTAKVNDIVSFLPNVKNQVLDAASGSLKPQIESLYLTIDDASKNLNTVAIDYNAAEVIVKSPTDDNLKALLKRPKESSLALIPLPNDHPSDINNLVKLLKENKEVYLKANKASEHMVRALASQLYYKVAANYGLMSDNVIGFDPKKLDEVKDTFALSDEQYQEFLRSLADATGKEYAQGQHGEYDNIFIVPADKLNVDTKDMITTLGKYGKVLVITSNKDHNPFTHEKLTIAEGMNILDGMLKDKELKDHHAIVEKIIKIAAAFNQLNIYTMAYLAEQIMIYKEDAVDGTVYKSLAKMNISQKDIIASGIMADDASVVQDNINKSTSHYINKSQEINTRALKGQVDDLSNQADLLRQQSDTLRLEREMAIGKNKAKQALHNIKREYGIKKSNLNDAITSVHDKLDDYKNGINNAIDEIKTTADKCFISSPPLDTIKFKEFNRKNIYNINFFTTSSTAVVKALKGEVNEKFDPSWISCLLFDAGSYNKLISRLESLKEIVNNNLRLLDDSVINRCVSSNDMLSCLKHASDNFNHKRAKLVNDNVSDPWLWHTLNSNNFEKIPNQTNYFWKNSAAVNFAIPTSGLGYYLNVPNMPVTAADYPLSLAYKNMNRNYYLRSLLNIIGSDDGSFHFMPNFTRPITMIKTTTDDRYKMLKPLLADFDDNNTLMIKAKRTLNKEYHHVVAYTLARILYEDIAKVLYHKVLKPFFSLDSAEFKLFQEGGAVGSDADKRKQILTHMNELSDILNDLALALNKPLIVPNDGINSINLPNQGKLYDLAKIYEKINHKIIRIYVDIAVPGLSPALKAKFDNMENALEDLMVKMDIGGSPYPWSAAPAIYQKPSGSIGQNFMHAFYQAYDLHKFTYFDEKAQTLADVDGPSYPSWHEMKASNADSPYHIDNIKKDARIKAKAIVPTLTDVQIDAMVTTAKNEIDTNADATLNSTYNAVFTSLPAAITDAMNKKSMADAISRIIYQRLKFKDYIRHPLER